MQRYFFHTDAFSREAGFLQNGQWTENVLFDHIDDQVQMWNDHCGHAGGISKQVVKLLEVPLTINLLLDMLGVVIQVQRG